MVDIEYKITTTLLRHSDVDVMDPIHLSEWIHELKNPDLKQGDGFLYQDAEDSFCCLGVYAHKVVGFHLEALNLEGQLKDLKTPKAKTRFMKYGMDTMNLAAFPKSLALVEQLDSMGQPCKIMETVHSTHYAEQLRPSISATKLNDGGSQHITVKCSEGEHNLVFDPRLTFLEIAELLENHKLIKVYYGVKVS